jgi:hypothetical protein
MPINSNIALGVQPLQVADPLARYSQVANIQSAQNQNALAQYQLSAAQRADEQQNKLYAASQQPEFKLDFASAIKYGAPGLAAFKAQEEAAAAGLTRTKTQGEIDKQKYEAVDSRLKFFREGLDTIDPANPSSPQAYKNWIIAGHNDPIIGPAIKARGGNLEQSLAQVDAAVTQGPQAFSQLVNQSRLGVEKFMELNKPTTTTVDQGGQRQVLQTPGLGGKPVSVGTYADVPLPANVFEQKKQIARAGASNITMSTEKAYGSQLAGKLADADINKMTTAEKAPQLADSANRIIDLVKQGNVFTGPVADVKLNIARVLNVAGASNDEKIANTEALIAATGQSTLDAIKGAGLGTNQGFTDKDLRFLQGIAGGTIQLTPQTLTELARLQHQAAVRSADAWNKRVTQLPKSATEGTGLSTEAIKVPPLSSVTGTALRPAGVGPNWTFEKDAAGNKAWVSPDRKSFKEAQ